MIKMTNTPTFCDWTGWYEDSEKQKKNEEERDGEREGERWRREGVIVV